MIESDFHVFFFFQRDGNHQLDALVALVALVAEP